MQKEMERNRRRYDFLKWGAQAFHGFNVVPPGIGICHQVNLEYLAKCVFERDGVYFPDTLVGTDSHTTMVNGMGVVGWGVGGIEAEAGMLGQPIYMLEPDVIGVHITGELPAGATATDAVLHVTELLRRYKVVGKFVEYFGPGPSRSRCPTGRRSPTWPRSTGRRWATSRWTSRPAGTCTTPVGRRNTSRPSGPTTGPRGCSASRRPAT